MGSRSTGAVRARVRGLVGLAIGCALLTAIAVTPGTASGQTVRATRSITDVDPDTYVCPLAGFVGFENFTDTTALEPGSVAGVTFTSGSGGVWSVGDYASGNYNGKFPAGKYTSEELHWAWPGPDADNGRITLAKPAKSFSVLVSNTAPMYLDVYSSTNTLIATVGPTAAHSNGVRHMIGMQVTSPTADITSAVVRDKTGAPFAVDSLCTDSTMVPKTQLTLSAADGPPFSVTTLSGQGFKANESVVVTLDGTAIPGGPVTTDANGRFANVTITIPGSAPPGEHKIVAAGARGDSGAADFLVHTDWSQYGFDPQHTGFNPLENTLGTSNVAGLERTWHGTTKGRATAPAVAEGAVYMGSFDGRIYKFNAAKGSAVIFKSRNFGEIGAAPAIADGMVFTGSGNGNVYALDSGNGTIRGTPYATGGKIERSPLVYNSVVYIGSDDGYMYAFNESYDTGLTFKWRQQIGTGVTPDKIRSAAATDGTNLYFGADDGHVHALNLETGEPVWTSDPTGGAIRSNPAVVDGQVVVGSDDGSVYAFSTLTGHQTWSEPLDAPHPVRSSPTVANGVVYVGSDANTLYELSLATGDKLLAIPVAGPVNEKPAVANGVVYFGVGIGTGAFVAADAATGEILKTVSIKGSSGPVDVAGVAVSDGAIYTVANNSEVKFSLPSKATDAATRARVF